MLKWKKEEMALELDSRKLRILAAIVSQHIQSGEPVGSKAVCSLRGIEVSSATVRNEMSALFEMGFLEQPHTSAGRIPSHLGYRRYVDELMRCEELTQMQKDELDALFNIRDPDPDRLIEDATQRLADYSGCAAVSATKPSQSVYVKRVELLPIDRRTVLIIVLANNGVIKSKVCRVDFVVTADLCEFFRKFSNDRLCGRSLYEISLRYLSAVAVSLGDYSQLFTPLLSAIYELCKEVYDGQYYTGGIGNILGCPELSEVSHDLYELLCDRERMRSILFSQEHGVRVFIGKENRSEELTLSSLMVAHYLIGSDSAGTIGIIGPVRLPYQILIPRLEYFASTLGKLLSDIYSTGSGGN